MAQSPQTEWDLDFPGSGRRVQTGGGGLNLPLGGRPALDPPILWGILDLLMDLPLA